PHVFLQLLLEGVRPRLPFLEDDISDEGLPFDRMRLPDDRGLRDLAMAHEGGLHLHRTDPVARDVDHVVDAAHEPEVVVLVHAGPVPREVFARDLGPVHLLVPLRIFVQGLEHGGPRLLDHEIAALVHGDGMALFVDDLRVDPRNRSGSGQSGAPSYMKTLAPFARGPYTMYEWPVTHPMSAVHQYRSSSFRSKTYFIVVATPTRYPPVECWMPFGFPVVPDVYRMKSGSVAFIASGSHSAAALAMRSCHQWSRPSRMGTSAPVRRKTTTCRTTSRSAIASSTIFFSGRTVPRR